MIFDHLIMVCNGPCYSTVSRVHSCVFFTLRASTLSNAVSSLASTGMSFTKVDEREKQAALEEEQARLKALKVAMLRERIVRWT